VSDALPPPSCKVTTCQPAQLASAAKELGWPKVVDIPAQVQHATDGMIAEWLRPQAAGGAVSEAPKKPSQQQRLEHFCRVLARLTSLQVRLKSPNLPGKSPITPLSLSKRNETCYSRSRLQLIALRLELSLSLFLFSNES
jgi:hypothetical protein